MWSQREIPSAAEALPGRARRMRVPRVHFVNGDRYAGGVTPNPTYEEVCTGLTGHNEVVRVVYDPAEVRVFWEAHDPTQGMRQGNDLGTQYRSGIYFSDEAERKAAETSRETYGAQLARGGDGAITTQILPAPEFYYAEDYQQQYLAKNPDVYCGLGGCGIAYNAGNA
jgi:peptide-methionine (S)-S-oxide reductase